VTVGAWDVEISESLSQPSGVPEELVDSGVQVVARQLLEVPGAQLVSDEVVAGVGVHDEREDGLGGGGVHPRIHELSEPLQTAPCELGGVGESFSDAVYQGSGRRACFTSRREGDGGVVALDHLLDLGEIRDGL
jgi:hypothetical protein